MNTRKLHKTLGFIMLLPFVAWAITGVFFFIKPGYSDAYHQLSIKTYPKIQSLTLPINNRWYEVRSFHTVLGSHLIVNLNDKWQQLNIQTFEHEPTPTADKITLLINDATKSKPSRYGKVVSVNGLSATTSTNIKITLNWQKMTLHQQGKDTDFINTMYKIHYLQWTGIASVDKVLGIFGLGLVVLLGCLGVKLSFRKIEK